MIELNLSEVEFSMADIRRKIKIPSTLDSSLAELLGIHVGDGNIYQFPDHENRRTQISYFGDDNEDYEYYLNFVIPLLNNLFRVKIKVEPRKNWFMIRIHSLAIFTFYTKVLHLPVGKKANIAKIPEMVLKSKETICSFLRGLADADFSLTFQKKYKEINYYPIIKVCSASSQLIMELDRVLFSLGFKTHSEFNQKEYEKRTNRVYNKNYLYLNGKKNLELWMKLINFHNSKHLTKYLVWKKFGFCPPKTTLRERKDILSGIIDPNSFYRPL